MKQRFAEFLQRTDGKQDMVDDFVPWRRCWQLGYPTWNWNTTGAMSQNIQNPGHPSYKFLILFSHLLGCLSRQCSLEKSLLRPLENYGIQNPFPMGSPGPFISEITSCQKKNYIQTQLGCLTSKDIIEVEQYSTNSNPSNNLFSNYKSIYIYI